MGTTCIQTTNQPVSRSERFHPLYLAKKLKPSVSSDDINFVSSKIKAKEKSKFQNSVASQKPSPNIFGQFIQRLIPSLFIDIRQPEQVLAQRNIKGDIFNHLELADHKIAGLRLLIKNNSSDLEALMSLARILTELTEDTRIDDNLKEKYLSEAQSLYQSASQGNNSAKLLHVFVDNEMLNKTTVRALEHLLLVDKSLSKVDRAKIQWETIIDQLDKPIDKDRTEQTLREVSEVLPSYSSYLIRYLKDHRNSQGVKEVYANWIKNDPNAISPYFGLGRFILNDPNNTSEPNTLFGIMDMGNEKATTPIAFKDRATINDNEFQFAALCLKRAAELRKEQCTGNETTGINFIEPHYYDKFKQHYQLAA